MKLREFGARLTADGDGIELLAHHGGTGSPAVIYRQMQGHPVPYTTTIQREGETLTVGDVLHQLALDGPVAYWLWYHTVADLDRVRMMPPDEPAYLPELEYADQVAREMSILPIDVGFDVRMQKMVVQIRRAVTTVIYDWKAQTKIIRGDEDDITRALRRAGYRVAWTD